MLDFVAPSPAASPARMPVNRQGAARAPRFATRAAGRRGPRTGGFRHPTGRACASSRRRACATARPDLPTRDQRQARTSRSTIRAPVPGSPAPACRRSRALRPRRLRHGARCYRTAVPSGAICAGADCARHLEPISASSAPAVFGHVALGERCECLGACLLARLPFGLHGVDAGSDFLAQRFRCCPSLGEASVG